MARVLVTNDDGVDSAGLDALARAAREEGHEVVVAAPHQERSGSSASLTALRSDGHLVFTRTVLDGGVPAFSVRATPAFISLVARRGAFGDPPDMVLSGINRGPNTGNAILHSGTVGAALTASASGCAAMAVSLATSRPQNWDTARTIAAQALRWLAVHGTPSTILNVNVPDVPLERLCGIRTATLARFGAVQANVAEVGEGYAAIGFTEVVAEHEEGTDAALLAQGFATLTALRAPCAMTDVDLSELES